MESNNPSLLFYQKKPGSFVEIQKGNSGFNRCHFECKDVEKEGIMHAYNDVLPYGDQMSVTIDGKRCLVLDWFCLGKNAFVSL